MTDLYWRDERLFWDIINTTPSPEEADQLLQGVRFSLIEMKQTLRNRKNDREAVLLLDHKLSVINSKIKSLNIKRNDATWESVVKDLWGEEGLREALSHKRRLFSS